MDAGHAIGRRRSFVEDIGLMAAAHLQALVKSVLSLPDPEDLVIDVGKIETLMLRKFLSHCKTML